MIRSTLIPTYLCAPAIAILAIALLVPSTLYATPIFDVFGALPQATFGGTGIPNDEVAVGSQFADGTDVLITIAMSATQRFSNPALTNDSGGTYFAQTGSNFGGAGESATEGALWNWNYYMEVEGFNGATPVLADYQIDLFYDFDPGFDTPIGGLGKIDVTAALLATTPAATVSQDSQNLLFGFLAASTPPFITAPGGIFDPNAVGEYNFAIQVSNPSSGFGIETIAMDVQVVPEPGTFGLAALGIIAIGFCRRKR